MDGTADAITPVSKDVVQAKGADAGWVVGGDQTERYEFAARQAGKVEIKFQYKRPWDYQCQNRCASSISSSPAPKQMRTKRSSNAE
jgi:hypothetical protein